MATVTVNEPLAPATSAPTGHTRAPPEPTAGVVVHPTAEVETKVVLGGVLKVTVVPLAVAPAPFL